ncbi:MAG: LytTR family transcriptional regulator DNA-binding domain-containing protein [Saprospiraceae bacterium]|nr:LytTR family transcriptional regulator DNA-binding domain-containing protein [Saprospiraceae bacterium]
MSEQQIRILVVEDEMLIGAKISMFLTELGYEVAGLIPRAEEALQLIETNPPDIALLDIHLSGAIDGIELATTLHQLPQPIPVIFLTANSDDATFNRAKTANPFAFLSKPFNKTALQRALELTINLMAKRDPSEAATEPTEQQETYILSDRIFVRQKDKMVKILFDNMLYAEADRNYCKVYTQDKEYLLTMPLGAIEKKLPGRTFLRVHRSYIINLEKIDALHEQQEWLMLGKYQVPVSRNHREELMARLRLV